MADNSVVQTIKDAEIDARSLSEFISKDASFMVDRRLAPTIHTLEYYLQTLNSVDNLAQQAQSAISATVDEVTRLEPRIVQMVNDAIDATAIPEGLVDTLVTVTKTTSNAITRTQSSLNSDYINVKNYGAKGDGIADDTQAFKNAILDAPMGATIYMPRGVYRTTSPIEWRTKLSLVGDGMGSSIIKPDGTRFDVIVQTQNGSGDGSGDVDPLEDCRFEDFEIDLQGLTSTAASVSGKGLYMLFMIRAVFRNLYIHHSIGTGLGCDFLVDSVIDSCVVNNCGKNYANGPSTIGQSGIGIGTGWKSIENVVVTNCTTRNNGNYGVFVEWQNGSETTHPFRSHGAMIVNCYSEGNRVGFGNSHSGGVRFVGCWAKANKQNGFVVSGGKFNTSNTLLGCISEENGNSGYSLAFTGGSDTISSCKSLNNSHYGIQWDSIDTTEQLDGSGLHINDCMIINSGKAGIYANISGDKSKGACRIVSNYISNSGEAGVFMRGDGLNNVMIENNTILNSALAAINIRDLKGTSASSTYAVISNNHLDDGSEPLRVSSAEYAVISIRNNNILGFDNPAVFSGSNTSYSVSENTFGKKGTSYIAKRALDMSNLMNSSIVVTGNDMSSAMTPSFHSSNTVELRNNKGVNNKEPVTVSLGASPATVAARNQDAMLYLTSESDFSVSFGATEVVKDAKTASVFIPANTPDVVVTHLGSMTTRVQLL